MKSRIYLDNNSATVLDPRVKETLMEFLSGCYGNPSSSHSFGRDCRNAFMRSRDTVASFLGVKSEEIVFTSGGTEGANLIIKGIADARGKGHIITSSIEHACVYHTIQQLEKSGFEATYLDPGSVGAVSAQQVEQAIRPDTILIAIMAANNETGVISPTDEIAHMALQKNIPFFVDGVAALGKEAITISPGVSAMCFSGQKIHCIQGTGCCFIRKNLRLSPLITGGEQQLGRRGGTENLPGIVALAKAVSLIEEEFAAAKEDMLKKQKMFEEGIQERLHDVVINGEGLRLVNTTNVSFLGADGETLLSWLDMEGVAASHGSACSSGAREPSRVLHNMGLSKERVDSSIRFSFSRFTTAQEIEQAVAITSRLVKRLRHL